MSQAILVYKGCPFRLGPGACLIGRDPDICDIALDNPHLSRRHALVVPLDGEYTLIDFKSMNGVMIKDQQHRVTKLSDGDVIQLAGETLQFFREKRDRSPAPRAREEEGNLQHLLNLSQKARTATCREALIESALEVAMSRLKAARGAFYRIAPGRRPVLEVARPDRTVFETGPNAAIRDEIQRLALRYSQPIFTQDARLDARFPPRAEDPQVAAFSALAVAIPPGLEADGLFYLEQPLTEDPGAPATFLRIFDQEDLEVLTSIAGIVGPALRRLPHERRRTSSTANAVEED